MTSSEKKQLQITACKVRMGVIESTYGAKAGHPGGSLSAAEVYTYLYFKEMNIDPANPRWEDRDRFVLSKGHTTPGLYSVSYGFHHQANQRVVLAITKLYIATKILTGVAKKSYLNLSTACTLIILK